MRLLTIFVFVFLSGTSMGFSQQFTEVDESHTLVLQDGTVLTADKKILVYEFESGSKLIIEESDYNNEQRQFYTASLFGNVDVGELLKVIGSARKKVRALVLNGCLVQSNAFMEVEGLPDLCEFYFRKCIFEKNAFSGLEKSKIRNLKLRDSFMLDELSLASAIEHSAAQLESITFENVDGFDGQCLSVLNSENKGTALRWLYISGCRLFDEQHLGSLAYCPNIRGVTLKNLKLSNEVFIALGKVSSLNTISISGSELNGGLEHLFQLSDLANLELIDTYFELEKLKVIERHPGTRFLIVDVNHLEDKDTVQLEECVRIRNQNRPISPK
jgi:hypothetical protein